MLFFSHLNRLIASAVIVVSWPREGKSHKIDDLPILATCWSDTLRCFKHRLTVLLLMEALDND